MKDISTERVGRWAVKVRESWPTGWLAWAILWEEQSVYADGPMTEPPHSDVFFDFGQSQHETVVRVISGLA